MTHRRRASSSFCSFSSSDSNGRVCLMLRHPPVSLGRLENESEGSETSRHSGGDRRKLPNFGTAKKTHARARRGSNLHGAHLYTGKSSSQAQRDKPEEALHRARGGAVETERARERERESERGRGSDGNNNGRFSSFFLFGVVTVETKSQGRGEHFSKRAPVPPKVAALLVRDRQVEAPRGHPELFFFC